jgi:hypothetical protein
MRELLRGNPQRRGIRGKAKLPLLPRLGTKREGIVEHEKPSVVSKYQKEERHG